MRYVVIDPDADVATIDLALGKLRVKRQEAKLECIRQWIGEDIEKLLDMRLERMAGV